jgi:NAD(P)-dependent dehydrogenase (short-subunit alcohol dehydrogenase family)
VTHPVSNEGGAATEPLSGKVAVVTGGGRGIGAATALKLASAGASVVVVARTGSELEAVTAKIAAQGGQARAHIADVTQSANVEALANELQNTYGQVDVLVNSAGVALIAPLDDTSEDDWDLVVDTNLKGPYLCIRAMLDLLRASDGAHVVNIASKVGLTGHELVAAYTAAKAGLIGLGRSLAQELATDNIRVTTICPGPVDTPMRWAATPDMDPRFALPANTVAETILFLVTLDGQAATNEIVVEAIAYDESAVPLGD